MDNVTVALKLDATDVKDALDRALDELRCIMSMTPDEQRICNWIIEKADAAKQAPPSLNDTDYRVTRNYILNLEALAEGIKNGEHKK